MERKSFLVFMLAAVLLFGGFRAVVAQSNSANLRHSMKGYELYSWRSHNTWNFSLLIGTNRLKKYSEVVSSKVRINGVAALKRKLSTLPGGEEVFWSSRRFRKLSLPSKNILDELQAYCEERGIRLGGR